MKRIARTGLILLGCILVLGPEGWAQTGHSAKSKTDASPTVEEYLAKAKERYPTNKRAAAEEISKALSLLETKIEDIEKLWD